LLFGSFLDILKLSSSEDLGRAEEQGTKTFFCSEIFSKRLSTFPLLLVVVESLNETFLALFC
jgi:hypothetical protein